MANWVLIVLMGMLGYCFGILSTLRWLNPRIKKLNELYNELQDDVMRITNEARTK